MHVSHDVLTQVRRSANIPPWALTWRQAADVPNRTSEHGLQHRRAHEIVCQWKCNATHFFQIHQWCQRVCSRGQLSQAASTRCRPWVSYCNNHSSVHTTPAFSSKMCVFQCAIWVFQCAFSNAPNCEALRDVGFSERGIWDIANVAGFYNMTNRVAGAVDMQPNPEYHGRFR